MRQLTFVEPGTVRWEEAAALVASLSRGAFPAVPEEQWAAVARQWFNEEDGRPAPGYDPQIAAGFRAQGGVLPDLWPLFAALASHPLLVIRGGNSDILSAATVEQMCLRHPRARAVTIPGQGHAPLLKDAASIGAIRSFVASLDGEPAAAARQPAGATAP